LLIENLPELHSLAQGRLLAKAPKRFGKARYRELRDEISLRTDQKGFQAATSG
jgi:hypothetical protein